MSTVNSIADVKGILCRPVLRIRTKNQSITLTAPIRLKRFSENPAPASTALLPDSLVAAASAAAAAASAAAAVLTQARSDYGVVVTTREICTAMATDVLDARV